MDPPYESAWPSAPLAVTSVVESQSWYSTMPHEATTSAGSVNDAPSPNLSNNGAVSEGIRPSTSPLNTLGMGNLLREYGSSDKKVNRDGQPAKRRGPKPDNKPAMTRRQALNRQAQRTHRQKKENYVRALEEQHVLLKSAYNEVIQEKEAILAENRMLKNLLRANGISTQKIYHNAASEYIDALSITDHQSGTFSRPINQPIEPYSSGNLSRSNTGGYFPGDVSTMPQRILSPNQSQLQQPDINQSTVSNYSDLEVDFTLSSIPRNNFYEGTMRQQPQPPSRQSSSSSFLQHRSST